MDCNMPFLDGFEATKKIIALCKDFNVPPPYIMALTGHTEDNDSIKKKIFKSGMSEMISKPISFDNLKKVLKR